MYATLKIQVGWKRRKNSDDSNQKQQDFWLSKHTWRNIVYLVGVEKKQRLPARRKNKSCRREAHNRRRIDE
jgi:hypothetical protein